MLVSTEEDVRGVATALLQESKTASESLTKKGVVEMNSVKDPNEMWVLFHITKDDIARLGDVFMLVIKGAAKGFGDKEKEDESTPILGE